jgi:hypothetical protein
VNIEAIGVKQISTYKVSIILKGEKKISISGGPYTN